MNKGRRKLRNPGPSWGYHFLSWADRWCPTGLFNFGVKFGAAIALCCMPKQRRYSREYLEKVFDGPVGWSEMLTHFYTLTQSLLLKLRIGRDGVRPIFKFQKNGHESAFAELASSARPALFGSFHVGHSDLAGCMLSEFGRKVRMVRERVGNAYDLKMLERVFGESVEFVWINEGESMLFALKNAAEEGASLALQCDREAHGSKHRSFDFLGAKRRFPVTIYHLAYLFSMPVTFSFGVPRGDGTIEVACSEVFEPVGDSKQTVLAAGYAHFQSVLIMLEAILQKQPYMWFNFLPLNTVEGENGR